MDKDSDPDVEYSYYYNTGWQVVEVRKDGAANPYKQFVWDLRYIDAPVLRWRDTNGNGTLDETLYYTNDPASPRRNRGYAAGAANMNVTALVNTSGAVVERYSYDPYGRVTVRHGVIDAAGQNTSANEWTERTAETFENNILYAGYLHDDETGLFHVRNRTYHPTLGRWLQRDPKDAGVPGGGYHDGMSLYAYARGNPISALDPGGTAALTSRTVIDFGQVLNLGYREPPAPLDTPTHKITGGPYYSLEFLFRINASKHNDIHYDIEGTPFGRWRNLSGRGKLDISEVGFTADSDRWKVAGEKADTARDTTKGQDGRCVECAVTTSYIDYEQLAENSGLGILKDEALGLAPGSGVAGWVGKKAAKAIGQAAIDDLFQTHRRRLYVAKILCADGKAWMGVYNLPRSEREEYPIGGPSSFFRNLSTRVSCNLPSMTVWDRQWVEYWNY